MNLQQLDNKLHRLSDSEMGYKNGTKSPVWTKEQLSGQDVPCLIRTKLPHSEINSPQTSSAFHVSIPALNLSINRNSRYSPVPTHTHDYIEISYMYNGQCTETIGNTVLTLQRGQVLILDTNTPHSVGLLEEEDILINLLMSHDYLHENLFRYLSKDSILSDFFVNALQKNSCHDSYLHFHSEHNRRIPMFFNELLCECCDPSINSTDIITSLITLIVAELINVYETELAKKELASAKVSFIPIIHYIEANFRTCTRKSVADFFHIHEKHLTTLIRSNTGMTYKQLVQSQKLRYAAKLLKNSCLPITEVITESGYENANFFYRKFREEYHMSPKDYRTTG